MSNPARTILEIGKELVALCQDNKGLEAVDRFYDEKIVSIEAQDSDELPARMEGITAVRGKNTWWYDNHEIHASSAVGPFLGLMSGQRENEFAVLFEMDVTFKPSGERSKLVEVALYEVANEKITKEEFWYLMA